MTNFYRVTTPSEWAAVPGAWSNSALSEIDACPRLWQYKGAVWGQVRGIPERPRWTAVRGTLIHEALERLFKACGAMGNPPVGTEAFTAAVENAGFNGFFEHALAALRAQNEAHPFGPLNDGEVPNARKLKNEAVAHFKATYRPAVDPRPNATLAGGRRNPGAARTALAGPDAIRRLRTQRGLSEADLSAPDLRFRGQIDRVRLDDDGRAEIIEFKTGAPRDNHVRQVRRYAVLWWSVTGDVPARVILAYSDAARSYDVSAALLEEWRQKLVDEIVAADEAAGQRPAQARPDAERCRYCPARARCDEGWGVVLPNPTGTTDLELVIEGEVTDHAFTGRLPDGSRLQVVYDAALRTRFPAAGETRRVRLTLVTLDSNAAAKVARVHAWSEVFWG